MRILLISGHGGKDSGACAFGRREADLAREIVPMIQRSLARYVVDVDIYDPKRSAYHDIIALGYDYNFKRYDYVLEVHFNASKEDRGNGKTKGCEIYVTPSENVVTVEQAIVNNISALGLTNRGVKRANMAVIRRAKAQGVSGALLEVCFLDDADDMAIYTTKKKQITDAVADGIADGFKLKMKGESNMAGFKDVDHLSDESKEAINYMASHGIVNGKGNGMLKPKDTITREEAILMMRRLARYAGLK